MDKWKIKINPNKSVAVPFGFKQQVPSINVNINNVSLEWDNEVKYLGIIFDRRLSWTPHIDYSIQKVRATKRTLYPFLARNSHLNLRNKLLMYNLIPKQIMLYGSTVWGQTCNRNLKRLEAQQSILLRQIVDAPWFVRNTAIRRDLKTPTLRDELTSRNRKMLSSFLNHPNRKLQYDPAESSRTKRPRLALA